MNLGCKPKYFVNFQKNATTNWNSPLRPNIASIFNENELFHSRWQQNEAGFCIILAKLLVVN